MEAVEGEFEDFSFKFEVGYGQPPDVDCYVWEGMTRSRGSGDGLQT
jgi:hypothetical protein